MDGQSTASPIPSQLNWRLHLAGAELSSIREARLYTDAIITGQLDPLDHISLLNTISHARGAPPNIARAAIVLRHRDHKSKELRESPSITLVGSGKRQPSDRNYHGGDMLDEIAAMLSLVMGIRLKTGPVDRVFEPDGDKFGLVMELDLKPRPELPSTARQQFPFKSGPRNLDLAGKLAKFPKISAVSAGAFAKACRLYQEAVWIADADPNLSWLLLVSAVETAAANHANSTVANAEEMFPEVLALLRKHNAEHIAGDLFELLRPHTKAFAKFRDFICGFTPEPPETRPSPFLRFSFSPEDLRKAAAQIYGYRSRALHDGRAFPAPMCRPPNIGVGSKIEYAEIPFGLASQVGQSSWHHSTTPMHLHTFEHIVRYCLLSWFDSLPEVWMSDMPLDNV